MTFGHFCSSFKSCLTNYILLLLYIFIVFWSKGESFIEVSVDQYQVFELQENANCTVNDVQYVSVAQVFDPLTANVSFTKEASQVVSIIEQLQSKHEASDLLVSISTAHKLEYIYI